MTKRSGMPNAFARHISCGAVNLASVRLDRYLKIVLNVERGGDKRDAIAAQNCTQKMQRLKTRRRAQYDRDSLKQKTKLSTTTN